jgi:hypothetical protein
MISSLNLAVLIIAGFLLIGYRKPIINGLKKLFKMERKGFDQETKKEEKRF